MNQPLFLHIVEKLEGLLGRLPAAIQKPILHELTPLKELFLQQRPPRLVLVGPGKDPFAEILPALFSFTPSGQGDRLAEIFRWQDTEIGSYGTISLLDARGADEMEARKIQHELERQPADVFVFLADDEKSKRASSRELDNLRAFSGWNAKMGNEAKIIAIVSSRTKGSLPRLGDGRVVNTNASEAMEQLKVAFAERTEINERLLNTIALPLATSDMGDREVSRKFMSLLTANLPNPARVEMTRISRDRAAQASIAHLLVKSTTAICTAIGAQPIPLADLPILTTLQLVMVSGIMYLSGRERSLRAATEFIGALGANVGAGMLLREGTRAVLKFFPGWGNIVCGMVAGAGTYAIGRAAIVFFIEGVSLRDARQTYLQSRKKTARKQPRRAEIHPGKA